MAFAKLPAATYNSLRPGHHLSYLGGGIKMRIGAFRTWRALLPAALISSAFVLSAAALTAFPGTALAQQTPASSDRIWQSLKGDVFGDRTIQADSDLVRIEAPKRAQDAALVPVDISIDPKKAPNGVKSLTLIIDVNPSPVAATFTIGKDAGVTHLSTRVRVNDYSFLRVIAETPDGKLYMTKTFVKASGGCSAPAVKNMDEAKKTMGQMKLRQFAAADGKAPELQLMIRHPNNSGLQRDPLTQYFIPAHFIQKLTISQADRPIMSMEGGISISEDPNFRFDYKPQGSGDIRVEAVDTEGKKFNDHWPITAAGL
jgi:sulfur-oxidizing protein SoxY